MKKMLLLALIVFLLAPMVFSENRLSNEISGQAQEFIYRASASDSKTIAVEDLARSNIVTSIAQGVKPENICVSLGSYASDDKWLLGSKGTMIKYVGDDDIDTSFFVLCERASKLRQAAAFFPSDKINDSFISHCPQFNPTNEELACAVILTSVSPKISKGPESPYLLFFAFAVVMFLALLFLFTCKSMPFKMFIFVKVVFLVAMLAVFYFIGFIFSTLAIVLLLFFFFVQANLTMAPMILEIGCDERRSVKIVLMFVLIVEAIGLGVAVYLMAPLL